MRAIEWTSQFKRDYKRENKGQHRATLDVDLFPAVDALANDQELEPRYRDHALVGEWKDHRDCHIKPDLGSVDVLPLPYLSHSKVAAKESISMK
jgi:mRNA interferase YafQ